MYVTTGPTIDSSLYCTLCSYMLRSEALQS